MKIARFSHEGVIAFGIVDDDELVVLEKDPMFAGFDTTGERIAVSAVKLLSPVIPRSKVVVMGSDFFTSAAAEAEDEAESIPRDPTFVIKPNTSVVGPGEAIVLPAQSSDVRVAGALAIIIGTFAKNVAVDDVESVIFGYTVATDVSARDLAVADGNNARATAFDSFCPLGPVIETECDVDTVVVHGRINDAQFQNGDTELQVHSIAEIVAFASSVFTLLPGDVILTGSPGLAVGGSLGATVSHGDTVQVEIPGIGVLVNPVRRTA
jgi:2-keto-4-pentenoate hydratase/2-oxohepta-3-ene-1,7-dioic acid hydratase in catechol pathway